MYFRNKYLILTRPQNLLSLEIINNGVFLETPSPTILWETPRFFSEIRRFSPENSPFFVGNQPFFYRRPPDFYTEANWFSQKTLMLSSEILYFIWKPDFHRRASDLVFFYRKHQSFQKAWVGGLRWKTCVLQWKSSGLQWKSWGLRWGVWNPMKRGLR